MIIYDPRKFEISYENKKYELTIAEHIIIKELCKQDYVTYMQLEKCIGYKGKYVKNIIEKLNNNIPFIEIEKKVFHGFFLKSKIYFME